ncbi:MAG: acyl carrier protein [Candidatus Sulfotelmatobacter sp.]|jgi:acyl carrier protein
MTSAGNQEVGQPSAVIRDQIREFVRDSLAGPKGIASFTDTESLTENGVVDSLGIFRLVSFLEDTFGTRISDEEITAQNLSSIELIEQLVVSKQQK